VQLRGERFFRLARLCSPTRKPGRKPNGDFARDMGPAESHISVASPDGETRVCFQMREAEKEIEGEGKFRR
jgi:hypothetical protein